MYKNAEAFKEYIVKEKLNMVVSDDIPEYTSFRLPGQILACGSQVDILVMFTNDDLHAHMYMLNFADVEESCDRAVLYEVINSLNTVYTLVTFFENEDHLSAKCCIPIGNNFEPKMVIEMLQVISSSISNEYEKLSDIIK